MGRQAGVAARHLILVLITLLAACDRASTSPPAGTPTDSPQPSQIPALEGVLVLRVYSGPYRHENERAIGTVPDVIVFEDANASTST